MHVECRPTAAGRPYVFGSRSGAAVILVRTGVGPIQAREVSRRFFLEHRVDVAVSSGFACALVRADIGDLLIGTDVIAASDAVLPARIWCGKNWTDGAHRSAQAAHVPAHVGSIASVSRIIGSAEDKHRVAQQTGAIALDMESGGIGASAAEYGIPFMVVRSVSDLLDEDLPLVFNLFLQPRSWPQALWASAARPRGVLELVRLRRQMLGASRRLTGWLIQWLDDGLPQANAGDVTARQGHA
jgi:adenosylhomocysteine nucleosidase